MAMRAIRSTNRDLFSVQSHSGTSSIKYRNWREPSDDGWRIQSVIERSASDYERSVSDSAFLHIEVNFARLEEDLQGLPTMHASIAEEGEERPSDGSIEASLLLLEELRIARVGVESVIPAADGGVAIVLAPSGDARAYLQILNNGERSLVMYNVAGDVYVEDLSSSGYLDKVKFHLKAKELASAY
jgi:hypothetical protein